jgi:hypothetical protein
MAAAVEASAAAAITVLPGWIADPGLVSAFWRRSRGRTFAIAYADEDETGPDGRRRHPRLKPSWSPALLESHAYMGVPVLVARSCWPAEAAGRRTGAEAYDLAFRVTEAGPPGGDPARRPDGRQPAWRRPHRCWSPATAAERSGRGRLRGGSSRPARRGRAGDPGCGASGLRAGAPGAAVAASAGQRHRADARPGGPGSAPVWPASPSAPTIRRSRSWSSTTAPVDPDALAVLEAAADRPGIRVLRAPGPFDYAGLNNRAATEARGEISVFSTTTSFRSRPDG